MLSAPELRLLPGQLATTFIWEGLSLDPVTSGSGVLQRRFQGRTPSLPSSGFVSCSRLSVQRKKPSCLFWGL